MSETFDALPKELIIETLKAMKSERRLNLLKAISPQQRDEVLTVLLESRNKELQRMYLDIYKSRFGLNNAKATQHAIEKGHISVFKLFVENDRPFKDGATYCQAALVKAASLGKAHIVKALVEERVNVNVWADREYASGEHTSPLVSAVKAKSLETVQILLRAEADVRANSGVSLTFASKDGSFEIARELIYRGAVPNGRCWIYAVEGGHRDILELFIEKGFGPHSERILEAAINKNSEELVSLLLGAGAPVSRTAWEATLVGLHTGDNRLGIIRLLLQYGHSPMGYMGTRRLGDGKYSTSFLSIAIEHDDVELVQLLLSVGVKPVRTVGGSDFRLACRMGNKEIITLLLEAGADPDGGLEGAVEAGNVKLIESLLEAGANPNSGLDKAVEIENIRLVEPLLRAGADPSKGLLHAVKMENIELVEAFLSAGADPSSGIKQAVKGKNIRLVEILAKAGAKLGIAILDEPIRSGNVALVRTLVEAGAKATMDHLEFAEIHGFGEIADLIRGNLTSDELTPQESIDALMEMIGSSGLSFYAKK
jgi:ankyrin repeat protein